MIAVLIATGSSVTPEQVEYVKGKARIYVINSSYKLAPWADVLYACDEEWWDYYKPEFSGEKWTLNESAAQKYGLNLIKYDPSLVFSTDDGLIATGHNSGFQALNLAYLQGARKIILIGFDYRSSSNHWFGQYPGAMNNSPNMKQWIHHMEKAAPIIAKLGVEVINCSPNSALDCFAKMRLKDAIC